MSITIDAATWEAVVREATAGIDWLNAYAAEGGVAGENRFAVSEQHVDDRTILLTEHTHPGGVDRRAVAWRPETGELLSARVTTKRGQLAVATKAAPTSWAGLASEGAAQIVKAARVLDYMIILGSRVTGEMRVSSPFTQ